MFAKFTGKSIDCFMNFLDPILILIDRKNESCFNGVDAIEQGFVCPEYRVDGSTAGFLKLGADFFEWKKNRRNDARLTPLFFGEFESI